MMHAPVSETKSVEAAIRSQARPMPLSETHPHAMTAPPQLVGAGRRASVRSDLRHRQTLSRAQSAYGNHAVLRMLNHSSHSPGALQRKCTCAGKGADCAACQEKQQASLRRKIGNQSEPEGVPPVVNEVLHSGGQPLSAEVRDFMEPRFGEDFSQVRVHTDEKAAESARAVNALAYTVGQKIVFGAGQYQPGTSQGQRLLAHELAHTLQNPKADISPALQSMTVSEPSDAGELEAESVAARVVSTDSSLGSLKVQPSRPKLQRMGDPSKIPPGLPCTPAPDSPASITEKVSFGNRGTTLSGLQKDQLENTARNWKAGGGNAPVRIDGFASRPGTEELNWRLSCDRALAVKAELTSPSSGRVPGIPENFITMFAQGEADEFGSDDENRVVTILVGASPPVPPSTPPEPPPEGQHICGPDITEALANALAEVRAHFAGLSATEKKESCDAITGITTFVMAWDIHDLFLPETDWLRLPPFHPPCGMPGATGSNIEDAATCSNSVQVRDKCFLAGTVNYAIFGQICRLCNDELGVLSEQTMINLINLWKLLTLITFDDPGPPTAWARAGFHGFPGHMPANENRAHCTGRCSVGGVSPFSWVWEPHHPRRVGLD